ncbi:GNAT family N-acetyltransferase [Ruania halotolerans]|uniref:GNAT family N-acetyltransferase n=1 Tax=Ruania halotolerans TaxID=2897773 RepID=UPI001E512D1B|nr:GNAT family N-acetyltransferase [Ruania halotolerans]UFU04813.1 GNAT family N-acetyltransferase [Ruania halotolerans]
MRQLLSRSWPVDQSLHPGSLDLHPSRQQSAGVDLEFDSLAGVDPDGALRTVALVRRDGGRALLWAMIDPGWRGRGIGRAMLRWQDACAQRAGAVVADILVDETRTDQRRLAAAAGFTSAGRVRAMHRTFTTGSATSAPAPRTVTGVDGLEIHREELAAGTRWQARRDGRRVGALEGAVTPAAWPDHGVAHLQFDFCGVDVCSADVALPLLAAAVRAYASADMVTARIDVDVHQDGVLDAAGTLGFTTLGEAIRYTTGSSVRV